MKLSGKRIAILATNGFEQSELSEPMEALKDNGAAVEIVSLKDGSIRGWKGTDWGDEFKVDKVLSSVSVDDYDGLVLPGGVINPDILRRDDKAVNFVRGFFEEKKQKPVAAICHGPWTLINAEVVKDRKVTSFDSIKKDLVKAGANWVDQEVVVDNGLVTSRTPEDLPAFKKKMIEEFCEGQHLK